MLFSLLGFKFIKNYSKLRERYLSKERQIHGRNRERIQKQTHSRMDTCFMTKMTWQSTGERMVFQQMVKDQMHIHMEKDET